MDKLKFINSFKNNKLFLSLGIFFIFLFLLFSIFYNGNFKFIYQNVFSNFEIIDANFDLNLKKVPYNSKSIDITFSKDLDKNTINKTNFTIVPEVKGSVVLKDNNTISYILEENLKIGFDYVITIKKDVKSKSHNNLDKDYTYIIKVGDESQVIKFIPGDKLNNLTKNIGVFFSNPMVSLTTVENKLEFDCPIEITPKVEGKCFWTTNSILEFEPKNGFAGATKYEVIVKNSKDFNYPLSKEYKTTFSTQELIPNLANSNNNNISPKDGIILNFNFPVEIDELKNSLDLNGEKPRVEKNNLSDVSFIIKPKNSELIYDKNYNLLLKAGLKPKYGNIPLAGDFNIGLKTNNLLNNFTVYKNQYSQTGALVGTQYLGDRPFLPKNNSFLRLNFDTNIELDKKLFLLESEPGKKIDFKLDYVTRNYDNTVMKNVVDLTLLSQLKTGEKYSFKILSDIDKNLTKDIVYDFSVPKELQLYDLKFINYKKLCLYTNNILDDVDLKNSIILPKGNKIYSISKGQYVDYPLSETIRELSFASKNKKLLENGYCAEPVNNQVLYTLDVRLAPNAQVEVQLKDFKDLYGSTQNVVLKKTFKTNDLDKTDKYIYTSFKDYTNVYPNNLPINFNLQTINTSKVYLDVCEMSEVNYFSFLLNEYGKDNSPKCFKKYSKEIPVKNYNWNISNTFVELEKEVLNKPKNEKGIFYIRTYLDKDLNQKSLQTSNFAIKTNLGIQVEKGINKTLVFATDLKTNKVINNLNIEVYDHNLNLTNQIFKFNKEKQVYEFNGDLSYSYIKVSSNTHFGVITSHDYMDNYDFKYISGQSSYNKYFSYVYTDRPIYRQGDEVFIKGIFRKFEFDGYKKPDISKVKLEIYGEYRWDVYRNIELNVDKNGNFNTSFIIPNDSELGNFKFRLKPVLNNNNCDESYIENGIFCDYESESIYTAGDFSIEQYVKPTFKVDLQTDNEEKYYGSKTKIEVEPKYYFGGKVTNTTGRLIVLSQDYFFDPKDYIDYTFGNNSRGFECIYWGYCNFRDSFEKNENFNIDENGKYVLDFVYKKPDKNQDETENGEKLFNFNFEITDPYSKKTVNNSVSKVVYLTDGYVGVKSNYYNSLKAGANLDFITLNHNAGILPNKKIDVEIFKREWIKNKVVGVDGVFYNNYELKQTLDKKFSLNTNNLGETSYKFNPKKGGEYLVKATYTGKNNQKYSSSTIFYIEGGDYISWRNENNSVTEVIAEKSVLNVGDTAKFMIKSPVNNGKILLVVQKDNGIFDYFVEDLKNYSHEFSYKITDKHYPNIYLKAYLIGSEENNPLPIYKRGLGSVKVLSDFKKLNVKLSTPKTNYLPGEELNVEVLVIDQNNKPVKNANLSLSVVDQSVLALKGNPKKNPYAFFYEMRRFLGTISYNNLYHLIEKLEVKDTSGGEKGGSGDQKGGETKKARGVFKDTAYFLSDAYTDKNGVAKINVKNLPDNLTTWVIEAVVNTSDSKFGVGYSDIFTTQKVIIQDNLPTILNTGDKIIFTPTIFNKTNADQEFEVKFSTSKKDFAPVVKKVFLKSNDAKNVEFEFENIRDEFFLDGDLINIVFEANGLKTKDFDKISKNILVNDSYLKQTTVTSGYTKDLNIDENINLKGLENRDGNLEINLSPTLLKNNILSLDKLRDYGFNSLDYKNLYVFNIAIIKQLSNEFNLKFDLKKQNIEVYSYSKREYNKMSLDKYIKNYLSSLKTYRKKDGGFGFFEESKDSNLDLTIGVFKTLNYIKSIGYGIDNDLLNSTKAYIRNTIFIEKTCESLNYYQIGCILKQDKIKALNVLLDYDKSQNDLFDLYQTYGLDKDLSITNLELTLKLQTLTNLSQENKDILDKKSKEIIDNIVNNNLIILPRGAFISLLSGDKNYNTLKFLQLNSTNNFKYLQNSTNIINNMIKFVNFDYKFETQNSLEALLLFVKNYNDIKKTDFTFKLNINSKNIDNHRFYLDNIFQTYSKKIPLKDLKDNNNLTLAKLGKGNLYYDLILNYYIPSYEAKNIDSGFYIEKTYFSFDEYKKIKELKQKEYDEYFNGKITYDELKYKKNIESYLTPVSNFKLGDLIVVSNKIIAKNGVKNMIFESYIPSGSQIVNFELSTENKTNNILENDFEFSTFKNLDEKFFGYKSYFEPGFYNYSYILRITNPGEFRVKPTVIKDKDFNEIFGSTKGEKIIVTK